MKIQKQLKKITEPVTIGYRELEKTYVVQDQSKEKTFENVSLKKALREFKKSLKKDLKNS